MVGKFVAPDDVTILGEVRVAILGARALVSGETPPDALAAVVSEADTEVVPLAIKFVGRLGPHPDTANLRDVEFPGASHWARVHRDDFVLQVPHYASHVARVDVAEWEVSECAVRHR